MSKEPALSTQGRRHTMKHNTERSVVEHLALNKLSYNHYSEQFGNYTRIYTELAKQHLQQSCFPLSTIKYWESVVINNCVWTKILLKQKNNVAVLSKI
jgi:hypothetical protein